MKSPSGEKRGLTITELQNQIAAVEGFLVSFERLGVAQTPIPPYGYDIMAPSKWRISDWKRVRLAAYIAIFRSVRVYRGDETLATTDLKLVTLRDSYYQARYGSLEPQAPAPISSLDERRASKTAGAAASEPRRPS